MTTNKEWLFSLPLEEQYAWMNAEHAESPTSATMQQIGQVIEDTVKRGVYGDTAAQGEDSREQLEADIEEWASIMDLEDQIDMIHGWLNRRAAILEREMVKFNRRYFDCVEQDKKIAELQAKVDELTQVAESKRLSFADRIRFVNEIDELTAERDKLQELNEYHALQYELASKDVDRLQAQVYKLTAERDNWKANCEDWKKGCERYRSKFGKCIDYADAIHALMDDEGMA